MIRRSGFVTMVGGALIVSACGRQVTPSASGTSPGSGVPAGFMQVKFRTVQPFNFNNYSYVIIFNTSGDGSTPIAVPTQNAFAGYSFAIAVTGSGGSASATPFAYYRPAGPGTQPVPQAFQPTPQNLRFNLNTNGQGNEFTIIFNRLAIAGFNPTTNTPTPSPTPTATPTPSPSPTASSSASPSPSVSPTVAPSYNTTWEFNFFVVQGNFSSGQSTVVDSLGQGGGTDTTYASTKIDTTTSYESGPIYPNPGTHPTDQTATILSGDIANSP